MSIQELMAQRAEIDRQIADSKAAIFDGTVTEIVCSADGAGIPLDELAAALLRHFKKRNRSAAKKPAGSVHPAKYRSTVSDATWTGRGVKPKWFKDGFFSDI